MDQDLLEAIMTMLSIENYALTLMASASLVAQLVKNPPTMQETPVPFPESGRSAEEGIGYLLQYSCASLVAQIVKNPTAVWETWVDPWIGKIPWRREQLPTPIFWPGEFHSPWGRKESDMIRPLSLSFF